MTWRESYGEIIRLVIAENPTATPEELRKLCKDAFPFTQRKQFVYKAWLQAMEDAFGPSKRKLAAVSLKKERDDEATGQGVLL